MSSAFTLFLQAAKPSIVEHIKVPSRPERRTQPPSGFRTGPIGRWLSSMVGGANDLWRHQSLALGHIEAKENVVVATATASGKSLIFQAALVRELLEGNGTALVLYPQKALSGDQLVRWQKALAEAGVPESLVAEVHGDVSMADREKALEGRIILATPDVIHAWMMRQIASPAVRQFLGMLRYVVIDEAHTCESVFGSNSAYLFRRLRCAAARIKSQVGSAIEPLQFIAATATIADPQEHMLKLTGLPFALISGDENGAPTHGLDLLHIEGPAHGAPAEKMLADILTNMAGKIAPNSAIAFANKRQGVERIGRRIGREEVLPYRSGYEREDRKTIEDALRAGNLRAVVSTSALELGIDIPQFTIGLNLGLPHTLKALRQRVGRVGRSAPAVFAVIAPRNAFAELGGSLGEFYAGDVEPCHLYLDNSLVQFQNACCLREECQMTDGQPELPDCVDWPDGFEEIFALTEPGAPKPPELERIAMLGTGNPHFDYPLRRISECKLVLRLARSPGVKLGPIELDKAMREAFPGAIYLHLRKGYRVTGWRMTGYDNSILVEPASGSEQPKPLLNTIVSVSHAPTELIDGRLQQSSLGSMAETCLRVAESVYGYSVSGKTMLYSELGTSNPRMRSKHREFGTTGVVIRINEPWFKGSGEHQLAARRNLAYALSSVLMRDRSISPADVSAVHTGIAIHGPGGPQKLDDAIVVFDDVQGGLRLTTALYDKFDEYIARLRRGANLVGSEAILTAATIDQLEAWFRSLRPVSGAALPTKDAAGEDERLIYADGSLVQIQIGGLAQERRLLSHEVVRMGGSEQLMYQYESHPGVRAWVPHELVRPFGDDWRQVAWNPRTDTVREISHVG